MKTSWRDLGYRLCWHPNKLSGLWARVWYRYWCPYPIIDDDFTARACIAAGKCGCNNRKSTVSSTEGNNG